jgi:hypothetical protein
MNLNSFLYRRTHAGDSGSRIRVLWEALQGGSGSAGLGYKVISPHGWRVTVHLPPPAQALVSPSRPRKSGGWWSQNLSVGDNSLGQLALTYNEINWASHKMGRGMVEWRQEFSGVSTVHETRRVEVTASELRLPAS